MPGYVSELDRAVVASAFAGQPICDAAAIARLEQALVKLEHLLAHQDREVRRLRRVETAARDALAAMDLCLDELTGTACRGAAPPAALARTAVA